MSMYMSAQLVRAFENTEGARMQKVQQHTDDIAQIQRDIHTMRNYMSTIQARINQDGDEVDLSDLSEELERVRQILGNFGEGVLPPVGELSHLSKKKAESMVQMLNDESSLKTMSTQTHTTQANQLWEELRQIVDIVSRGLRGEDEQIKRSQQRIEPPKRSPAERETLYRTAFCAYEGGDYAQASMVFTELVLDEPFEERYWRGMAASRQMEQKYPESLHAWALVALLAGQDPIPHFHAAECLISLGDREDALRALKAAEDRVGNNTELEQKIQVLRQRWQK